MIDLLPKELIIEIFNLLPQRSLIALTETCKLFNEIISTNSILSEKLELHFVPENKILTWTGCRKYSKVYLEGYVAGFYLEILRSSCEFLKEIQIVCMSMKGQVLKEILLNCVNLKRILIKDNRIRYKDEDFEEPLPHLKLQILHYRNLIQQPTTIFRVLRNCQVRDLKIVGFSLSCEDLTQFIKNQTDMQSLAIHDTKKTSSIFATEMLNSVDFRLNKLVIDQYSSDWNEFENFLHNHRLSLRQVELTDVKQDFLKMLVNFPNLRELQIFEMYFHEDFPTIMLNVEKLAIGFDVSGCWAVNFPNLKEIKISWIQFKRDMIQIEELEKLEKVEIEFCCIPEFSIPTVKSLKLSNVDFFDERPFKLQNNQIEEITLKNCTNAEWLIDFVKDYAKKLRILRIEETQLSAECLKVVQSCSEKFFLQIYR